MGLGRVSEHIRGNAVGYVALFVALSGVAYAANAVPKNSVTSASIKKGAVKGSDVGNDALTGADISEPTLAQVPDSGQLDGLDSTAFVQDADGAGGDLSGPFSALEIDDGTVGAAELSSTALRPQDIAPNGTQFVSGTIPVLFTFAIDDGNDQSAVVPTKLLVVDAWTVGKTPDAGMVRVEGPGNAGITPFMDPTEDGLVRTAGIDPSTYNLDAGDILTADASNTEVDVLVYALAVPNIAP